MESACDEVASTQLRTGGIVSATSPKNRPEADFARFREPMNALVRRTLEVDVRHYETAPTAELATLAKATAAMVEEGCILVSAVVEECMVETNDEGRARSESLLPFDLAVDAAVEEGGESASAVEDIAFLVMLELRQKKERLQSSAGSTDPVEVLGDCDSALRRIRKGLGAIDVVIARRDEGAPSLDFSSELVHSLQVRRAYAKFRARVVRDDAPSTAELRTRLRAVGTHIAVLVGWSAFPLLRVRDRLQLRRLQQRILEWLRMPVTDEVAGVRLWQDVTGFVDMLAQVSRRQELVEHDAILVTALLARLESAGDLDDVATRAAPLFGRDDELDRWVSSATRTRADGHRLLERLAGEIGGSGAPR